jgi:ATP synthase F1 gamma subunit
MPSLKALKTRIASVKSTRKITKAMQMVAAAKLRRAQDAAEQARPYTERFNAVMAGLALRDNFSRGFSEGWNGHPIESIKTTGKAVMEKAREALHGHKGDK